MSNYKFRITKAFYGSAEITVTANDILDAADVAREQGDSLVQDDLFYEDEEIVDVELLETNDLREQADEE